MFSLLCYRYIQGNSPPFRLHYRMGPIFPLNYQKGEIALMVERRVLVKNFSMVPELTTTLKHTYQIYFSYMCN